MMMMLSETECPGEEVVVNYDTSMTEYTMSMTVEDSYTYFISLVLQFLRSLEDTRSEEDAVRQQ